jgi:hypothetical protein
MIELYRLQLEHSNARTLIPGVATVLSKHIVLAPDRTYANSYGMSHSRDHMYVLAYRDLNVPQSRITRLHRYIDHSDAYSGAEALLSCPVGTSSFRRM